MQAAQKIAKNRVNFSDSLTACDIGKVNKGTKQPFRNEPGKTEIKERLKFASTDLLSPVMPAARANYRFMVRYSDHYTKFKVVDFISTKDKALTTLVKYVQDFVMLLGLSLLYLHAIGGGVFTFDYYHDHSKTTVIIQLFNSPNTPEQNDLSERDGCTTMDVAL